MEKNLTPFERLFHSCLHIWRELKNKKSRGPKRDLYDVTLGNPAIFQKQDTIKEAQRGILRPVAFRPHLMMSLALYRKRFELPTGKLCLLGAGHIHCEVFFYKGTS